MTSPTTAYATTVTCTTGLAEVLTAATELARAGRWDTADRLLAAARAGGPTGHAILALAVADAALDRDMFTGTRRASAHIDDATAPVAAAADPVLDWDLARLRLFRSYTTEVFRDGSGAATAIGSLVEEADRLVATAPDAARRGWASFYAALIADNLAADQAASVPRYEAALALADQTDDGLLASYVLRHLGGHDEDAGDLAAARRRWERSADLRVRAGHLTGALAQQVALATLTDRAGDRAAARAVAAEVHRWAAGLGLSWLRDQAAALGGADAVPEPVGAE